MRIEINSGGLGSLVAVASYQTDMTGFVHKAEDVISSFKTVRKQTNNLNGGVGNLQSALDDINTRIQKEEEKVEAATAVHQKTNDFLALAKRVDKQVAAAVDKNRDQFYKKYPHLEPPKQNADQKSWCEKAWAWLCRTGEKIKAKLSDAVDTAKDVVRKAKNGLVSFYEKQRDKVAEAFRKFKGKAENLFERVKKSVFDVVDWTKEKITNCADWVKDTLAKIEAVIDTFCFCVTFWHFELREYLNGTQPTLEEVENDPDWVLLSREESKYHDNGDKYPEKKYIHKDGREAVYDGRTGEVVVDDEYVATYNYCPIVPVPENPQATDYVIYAVSGVGHFFLDMVPYYVTLGSNTRRQYNRTKSWDTLQRGRRIDHMIHVSVK